MYLFFCICICIRLFVFDKWLTNAMNETSSPVNSLLTAALIVFGKCQCLGDGKIDIHRLAAVSRF